MIQKPPFLFIAFSLLISSVFVSACSNMVAKDNSAEKVAKRNTKSLKNPKQELSFYKVDIPSGIPSQEKMYEGFFLSFNEDNHTPNYVSWQLLDSETEGTQPRSDAFHRDFELKGCPDEFAYKGSGFDRGHMCPAADQKWSEEAMFDCFVMANMCPQANALNAGAWLTLENKERQWAKRDKAIWIVAGPVYNDVDTKRIGTFDTRVPGAFFKAFLYYNPDKPEESRAIAFVYPNMKCQGNMQDYALSIDDLEEALNYDFFYQLPDNIENKVEAEYSFTEWNK